MRYNRSVPPCAVIAVLHYPSPSEAAEWLQNAFGFTVRLRIENHRIQMRAGDGCVTVAEGDVQPNRSAAVQVRIEGAREHCERARRAGAKIVAEVQDEIYGESQYTAEDFHGHRWNFTETFADVEPESWGGVSVDVGVKPRLTSLAPQFLVDDLARSIAYYRMLGFTFGDPWDGFYAIGSLDGLELHLKESPKNLADRDFRRANDHLDAAAGVDGIEAFYERCVANGVTIVKPLLDTPWGTKGFTCRTPMVTSWRSEDARLSRDRCVTRAHAMFTSRRSLTGTSRRHFA